MFYGFNQLLILSGSACDKFEINNYLYVRYRLKCVTIFLLINDINSLSNFPDLSSLIKLRLESITFNIFIITDGRTLSFSLHNV